MPTTVPTVFISYSHKDEVWKDRLLEHLGGLEEEGLLKVWSDRNIKAGDEWFEEIRTAMDDAKVAVFLVSAHSLKSKFIRHQEIPHLLDRREKEGMTFFPVIVKDCVWDEFPWLSRFQVRPSNRRPLESFRGKLNSELTKIAKEILGIIRNDATGPQPLKQAEPLKLTILAPLHQLPTPPADFTGREEDLEFLRSELSEDSPGTILGIRGMGGVGKTTLALKLAEELKPRFPDAQIYLDLKGVDPQPLTAAQAMAHVIRSFYPEARLPESEAELAGLYRSVLDGKRVFLLMDNAARKEQVEPLIPPSTCLLLVTSRYHFLLPGMAHRDLNEMSEEDARRMLLKIAVRIDTAAAELAYVCGRLPLTLRLAGSALTERLYLSPTEYLERLKEGKDQLDGVDASINLSYELLNEEQQRLLRMLVVFSGTFDAPAASAVWEAEIDIALDVLWDLLRSSLIHWEEKEERYRLHDLVRKFAEKRIDTAEIYMAQRRHAEYYLQALGNYEGMFFQRKDHSLQALQLFDMEWLNIQAGFSWSAEYFQIDERAAQVCDAYPNKGSELLELRLHPRKRISWRECAISAARQLENRHSEGHHLRKLGLAYADIDDNQSAIYFYEKALAVACEIKDQQGESGALNNLGLTYMRIGETQQAIKYFEKGLKIFREIGEQRGEALALTNLGNAYSVLREIQRAIELYEQGLTISREIGYRKGESHALGNLGLAYANLGEPRRAIEFHKQQLTIAREIGDRRGEGIASWNLGVRKIEGDPARAVVLMQVYVDYLREIGHPAAEKHAAYLESLRARIAEQKSES
jgi:tetratricopeptide (TPR) repeat protein